MHNTAVDTLQKVATKFNEFSGRLGGVPVHLRISRAKSVALTASAAR